MQSRQNGSETMWKRPGRDQYDGHYEIAIIKVLDDSLDASSKSSNPTAENR
jgi:hypothetical protein